jgi:hypothetical protein
MTTENDQTQAERPTSAPPVAPRGRPVAVPHIDFETPVNENDLVGVRTGYGLTRPPRNPTPAEDRRKRN